MVRKKSLNIMGFVDEFVDGARAPFDRADSSTHLDRF